MGWTGYVWGALRPQSDSFSARTVPRLAVVIGIKAYDSRPIAKLGQGSGNYFSTLSTRARSLRLKSSYKVIPKRSLRTVAAVVGRLVPTVRLRYAPDAFARHYAERCLSYPLSMHQKECFVCLVLCACVSVYMSMSKRFSVMLQSDVTASNKVRESVKTRISLFRASILLTVWHRE